MLQPRSATEPINNQCCSDAQEQRLQPDDESPVSIGFEYDSQREMEDDDAAENTHGQPCRT